jgi:hypothetical protein
VCAHTLEIIALGNKVGIQGCLVDKSGDVVCDNMKTGADETQRGRIWATLGDDAMNATGHGFDWTKPAGTGSVVDGW